MNFTKQTEDQLQETCFRWFSLKYSSLYGLLFHVPNGGHRLKREAARFKRIGVVSGIPDFMFLYGGKVYGIELKVGRNKQTENQKAIQAIFETHGIDYNLVYTFEEFTKLIDTIVKN